MRSLTAGRAACWNHLDERMSKHLFTGLVPEAAERIVDECQRRIGKKTADHVALRVHDALVSPGIRASVVFRAAAPRALGEEANNQHELRREHGHAAGHVSTVHIDERLGSKEHDAAGRDAGFGDAPSLKLLPIEHRLVRVAADGNIAWARTGRDASGHRGHASGVGLEAPDGSADHAATEGIFLQRKDRYGRCAKHPRQTFGQLQVL